MKCSENDDFSNVMFPWRMKFRLYDLCLRREPSTLVHDTAHTVGLPISVQYKSQPKLSESKTRVDPQTTTSSLRGSNADDARRRRLAINGKVKISDVRQQSDSEPSNVYVHTYSLLTCIVNVQSTRSLLTSSAQENITTICTSKSCRLQACVCKTCFFWLRQLDAFVDHWKLSQLRRWFMLLSHRRSITATLWFCFCTEESHRQVAVCQCCSMSDHWDSEVRTWSVTADAWWPALADCSSEAAVQPCWDGPSLSSTPDTKIPHCLCVPLSEVPGRQLLRSARRHLSVPRVHRCTYGSRARPTVLIAIHCRDLRDPAVDSEQGEDFMQNLKTHLFAGLLAALAH